MAMTSLSKPIPSEDSQMTPLAIRGALRAIAGEAGPAAWADLSVSTEHPDESAVRGVLYPQGIAAGHCIHGRGPGFAEALDDLRSNWAQARSLADTNSIRRMAVAIIEITGDQGECSDAALRGAGFDQGQIARLGALACSEATRLAAGGPFRIIALTGANAEATGRPAPLRTDITHALPLGG